jgi:hypothetical protein
LHRIYEITPVLYPNADKLETNVKKIFATSPAIKVFKSKAADITFPRPLVIHRGNLIQCHCVLRRKLYVFCSVVNELDKGDASSIAVL